VQNESSWDQALERNLADFREKNTELRKDVAAKVAELAVVRAQSEALRAQCRTARLPGGVDDGPSLQDGDQPVIDMVQTEKY
jgi:hypothetical protein